MVKICSKCNQEKSVEEFHRLRKDSPELRPSCKACRNQENKQYFLANRADALERSRNSKRVQKSRNVKNLIEYLLEHPCVDCGFSDIRALDFDHQEDKKKCISLMVKSGYIWETIAAEIEKCVVRCANCHRIKTSVDFNYVKTRYLNGASEFDW